MMHEFVKYHSLGNDFVIIDWLKKPESYLQSIIQCDAWSTWVRDICARHTGVGADGILIIRGNTEAGVPEILVYNADGSPGQTCLNGLRCVAQYLVAQRGLPAELSIRMGERNYQCSVAPEGEYRLERSVTISMAPAVVEKQLDLILVDEKFAGFVVSVGNPHYICLRSIDLEFLKKYGPQLESHTAFANRTNVEFVWQDCANDKLFHLLVYERGCGITNACSSGAAATLWLLHQRGLIASDVQIELRMLGGSVIGWISGAQIFLQATAVAVFSGTFAQEPRLR
jgi:diaminopimelate epimerase